MESISNNAAYVIGRINDICGEKPGKKALHKIVYLIEKKGIDLGYDYGLHFYGPYSEELDYDINCLSSDGVIDFEYSKSSHLMSVDENSFLITHAGIIHHDDIKDIDLLIEHFKGQKASNLELLTTAIYAYDHLEDKSSDSVIAGVQKIKGSKYTESKIRDALKEFDYFPRTLEVSK